MSEDGYLSAYVSYDKKRVEDIANELKTLNITMKVITTTDSQSKETIYEVLVIENMIDKVHEIIINLQQQD
ncbi:MAG: hypothetical protein JXQ23_03905 [Clostridia bacterium]|nr:hypothetical protein [Clostridia bacterium]